MNKITFILLIFSLYITNIQGKNIFVSLQGNDKNNGNIETPFKSIARAIEEVKENDTIFIREGEYQISKSLNFNKTRNIVLQNFTVNGK